MFICVTACRTCRRKGDQGCIFRRSFLMIYDTTESMIKKHLQDRNWSQMNVHDVLIPQTLVGALIS